MTQPATSASPKIHTSGLPYSLLYVFACLCFSLAMIGLSAIGIWHHVYAAPIVFGPFALLAVLGLKDAKQRLTLTVSVMRSAKQPQA